VLRALKRLLRSGGRIGFTTIYMEPGLQGAARTRARKAGPRAVASRVSQQQLLRSAGYLDVDELDVTQAFVETTRAWITQRERHSEQLAALEAPGVFEERQHDHHSQLAATEDGLLRRGLFSATRP
jgi:hypothetical protein